MKAVLDTNALLLPFTDGTDLDNELLRLVGAVDWVVPAPVRKELEQLASGGGATARAAQGALRLLRRHRDVVEEGTTDLPGDDGVLDVARRYGAVVVSNDQRLQAEARRSGLIVVASRGKGRLHRLDG